MTTVHKRAFLETTGVGAVDVYISHEEWDNTDWTNITISNGHDSVYIDDKALAKIVKLVEKAQVAFKEKRANEKK